MTAARWAYGTAAALGAAALWALVAGAVAGGSPGGVVAILVASAAVLVSAALLADRARWIAPALVVGGAAVLAVVNRGEILSSGPAKGPFSYSNATGAFYLQATIAALLMMLTAPRTWARRAGGAAAVAFAGIVVASGSRAGAILLVAPVAALVAARVRRGREAVVAMGALVALAVVVTAVIGASYAGGDAGSRELRRRERVPEQRRQALWHEAVTLISERPLTGVGPALFQEESRLARRDPDARWAHQGFLQFGAETGLPGLALLAAAFGLAFAGIARADRPDASTMLSAASLAAFGLGSSVDYLMHFPGLCLTVAALVGTAAHRNTA